MVCLSENAYVGMCMELLYSNNELLFSYDPKGLITKIIIVTAAGLDILTVDHENSNFILRRERKDTSIFQPDFFSSFFLLNHNLISL